MLPTSFTDRFSQIMGIKRGELASEAQAGFAQQSKDLVRRGLSTPHVTHLLHHEKAVWITNRRIESALDAIKRLFSSGHELAYSETLAAELKQLLESWATETWCKQSIDAYGPLTNEQRAKYERELFQGHGIALSKAYLEIDLLVDDIKSKVGKAQTQLKEFDQKFEILLSARQARIDFEGWANELGPTGDSIAILFVDIDNFKDFNVKHTDTVIDETILPDAMRLIHKKANHRGGGYKQGGEEFLVILPNHDRTEAAAFAEKLRSAFESATFMVRDRIEHLTVSIGVALWPQHGQSYDEVLKRANQAEADAKHTKNICIIAD